MGYAKRAIKGISLIFAMSLIASGLSYITRIILARNLLPEEYGLFYAVFNFVIFFLFFRDLGIGTALSKYIPEFKVLNKLNEIKTAISSALLIQVMSSGLLVSILFILSDFLTIHYFKNPSARPILYLLLVYVFGSVFFRIMKSVFHGFQNFKMYALFEFMKNGIVLIIILIFFHFGYGVYAPAIAFSLVCFVIVFLLFPKLYQMFPFFQYKIESFPSITKKLLLFGLPVFLTSIGGKFISNIDTLLLTHFRSITEVGIYNVVLPSAIIFLTFGSAISATIFPMISELWAKNNKTKIIDGIKLIHKYVFIIIMPFALGVIAFSELIVTSFFGTEYAAGALTLKILMVGVMIFVVAGINHNVLSAMGKPKIVAKILLLAALLNLVVNLILIPMFGIEGAAVATSLSYLFALIYSSIVIQKIIAKNIVKNWSLIFVLGGIFLSLLILIQKVLLLNPWVELIISGFIAMAVYLLLLFSFNLVNLKEIRIIFK